MPPVDLRIVNPDGQQALAPGAFTVGESIPPSGTPHAHFEALAARPDCLKAWSLRSQAQLNSLVKQPPSISWTYDPAHDTHPLKQDACKLWKPPRCQFSSWTALKTHPNPNISSWDDTGDETVLLPLRIPIHGCEHSLTLTFDFWWGSEFQSNRGTVNAWKVFFLMAHNTQPTWEGSEIYELLHEITYGINVGGVPIIVPENGDNSVHHSDLGQGTRAPGVLDDDPFTPTGLGAVPTRRHLTKSNRWTRYVLHVRKAVPGSEFASWKAFTGQTLVNAYDMVSLWMCDETRDAVRVLYEVPAPRTSPYLNTFRFAFDTSTNNLTPKPESPTGLTGLTGPIVGYARNLTAHTNVHLVEGDPTWFKRPVAG